MRIDVGAMIMLSVGTVARHGMRKPEAIDLNMGEV